VRWELCSCSENVPSVHLSGIRSVLSGGLRQTLHRVRASVLLIQSPSTLLPSSSPLAP